MAKDAKNISWVLTVYALSFICYVPMLLRQSGARVPDALLYARYVFVLIPALVSAVSLLHMIFDLCFLVPAKYNNVVMLLGIMICYILKNTKEEYGSDKAKPSH